MPYHTYKIPKGAVGAISKIREELDELVDADEQNAKVMVILELSDMCGAMEAYLKAHHPSISMEDLLIMARITASAFKDGSRT